MATAIEVAQLQLDQSQWQLLGSHTYEQYQLFSTLHEGLYITPSPRESSLPSPTAHAVVQLNSNQRVMS